MSYHLQGAHLGWDHQDCAASNRFSSLKIADQLSAGESEKADDTCAGSNPAALTPYCTFPYRSVKIDMFRVGSLSGKTTSFISEF